MDDVLGLRPFVPARDLTRSTVFYEELGFAVSYKDSGIAILELGRFGFILQNFYVEEFAANCMMQLLVRDLDAWWAALDIAGLVARFAVKAPVAPAMQDWGLRVGFIFDPSGVLWQVTQNTRD